MADNAWDGVATAGRCQHGAAQLERLGPTAAGGVLVERWAVECPACGRRWSGIARPGWPRARRHQVAVIGKVSRPPVWVRRVFESAGQADELILRPSAALAFQAGRRSDDGGGPWRNLYGCAEVELFAAAAVRWLAESGGDSWDTRIAQQWPVQNRRCAFTHLVNSAGIVGHKGLYWPELNWWLEHNHSDGASCGALRWLWRGFLSDEFVARLSAVGGW